MDDYPYEFVFHFDHFIDISRDPWFVFELNFIWV